LAKPAVDQRRQRARRPALVVDVLGLQDLLEQAQLIVRIQNGEIRLEADQFGVAAQHFRADRVKGAEPRQAVGDAGQQSDPLAHFARRLVGEGDGEDLVRPRAPGGDEMGDAGRQHPRLADAGPRQHQHRPVQRLDRAALLGIEAGEIADAEMRGGARRQPGLRRWRDGIGPERGWRGIADHGESCFARPRQATRIAAPGDEKRPRRAAGSGFPRSPWGQFQLLIWIAAGVRIAANRPGRKNRIIGTVRVGGSAAAFFSAAFMRWSRLSWPSTRSAEPSGVP
jgi:hypothetical protein